MVEGNWIRLPFCKKNGLYPSLKRWAWQKTAVERGRGGRSQNAVLAANCIHVVPKVLIEKGRGRKRPDHALNELLLGIGEKTCQKHKPPTGAMAEEDRERNCGKRKKNQREFRGKTRIDTGVG